MAPLEPWKRVYVEDAFFDTTHGEMQCTDCHGGNPKALGKERAHTDLVSYPSEDAATYCSSCHPSEVATYASGLHYTQEGYYKRIEQRAGFDIRDGNHDEALEGFKQECAKCHSSCGQCHVSRPRSVYGGFNWGHVFKKKPDLKTNCTACHGSRIGDEYTGANEELQPDAHYVPGAKSCEFCHVADEMHGVSDQPLINMFDDGNTNAPSCANGIVTDTGTEQCHATADETSNDYHAQHWKGDSGVKLTCQVCHSQNYRNCNGCHVDGEGITGSSYWTFEIGKNYLKDNERYKDYDYITVRHIPVAPDTFSPWGITDLAQFESQPTWKLTVPHNIQKWTPQTTVEDGQSCSLSCHDTDYYLRETDVAEYADANYDSETGESGYGYDDTNYEIEKNANKDVFIPE